MTRPVFEDFSSEGEDAHDVSYSHGKMSDYLHGKMQALGIASSHSHSTTEQDSALSTSADSRLAPFRDLSDDPPIPISNSPNEFRRSMGDKRRATLDMANKPNAHELKELTTMYATVAECLDMRRKFMKISLQYERENPKNQASWKIYPPPPEPEYDPVTKHFLIKPKVPAEPEKVGYKFDMAELEIPGPHDYHFVNNDGIFEVFEGRVSTPPPPNTFSTEPETQIKHNSPSKIPISEVPSLKEYYAAVERATNLSIDGPAKSFAFRRLQYLEARWNLYFLLNQDDELAKSKRVPHRDFYNVRKVDTHVHHSACMTQKHLLRFIKSKMKKSPHEVVIYRDGKLLTLAKVFESLGLSAYDLNIDTLDMHAHSDAFHRFDKFNLKYNPIGESRLREIFLKTDNFIQGRYLAEITKEVFSDLEQSKYQMAEYRISIYGRHISEWSKLAAWVVDNKLVSDNVRWLIQVPRLYDVYRKGGMVSSFGEVVNNVFKPLFEVTQDPSKDPKLHVFLQRVVGFDSVDDESKADRLTYARYPVPSAWDGPQNPPYSYYLYYLYANMASLNQFRYRLGYNTFVLRPHCGEAGDPEHLVPAFITSQGISHGILLRKLPFMQFLYYLDQVGIAMSPISNNALFLSYEKNPFMSYFRKGLNVSLSSDDPLQFSFTREPLIEEYSIAIQIYKLTAVDSRELALYSVMQSGFEHEIKNHWGYNMHTGEVNIEKTNVPRPRLAFREETLKHERHLVEKYGKCSLNI